MTKELNEQEKIDTLVTYNKGGAEITLYYPIKLNL